MARYCLEEYKTRRDIIAPVSRNKTINRRKQLPWLPRWKMRLNDKWSAALGALPWFHRPFGPLPPPFSPRCFAFPRATPTRRAISFDLPVPNQPFLRFVVALRSRLVTRSVRSEIFEKKRRRGGFSYFNFPLAGLAQKGASSEKRHATAKLRTRSFPFAWRRSQCSQRASNCQPLGSRAPP